jgi:hypothetical protein
MFSKTVSDPVRSAPGMNQLYVLTSWNAFAELFVGMTPTKNPFTNTPRSAIVRDTRESNLERAIENRCSTCRVGMCVLGSDVRRPFVSKRRIAGGLVIVEKHSAELVSPKRAVRDTNR